MALCLNVGCHDIHLKNYVNIDLDPSMKPDLLVDATRLLEYFQENSVDHIYCGHFLEHFSLEQAQGLVNDFYRLLKPYCSLHLVVPDHTKCSDFPIEQKEVIVLAEGHKTLMDGPRVISLVKSAGFLSYSIASDLHGINHCMFPEVAWQTGVMATKLPAAAFESPSNK